MIGPLNIEYIRPFSVKDYEKYYIYVFKFNGVLRELLNTFKYKLHFISL